MNHNTKLAGAGPTAALEPPERKAANRGASIKEVAKLANVGLGTVSRVINGAESVSDATRSRVMKAIAELDYVPNIVAQSMRNHRTMTFACVVRDFTVPVLSMFVDAMQKTIDPAGFSLIVASSYHDLRQELGLLQRLQQRRIDGLVITTSSEQSPELMRALINAKFPVVLMDRRLPEELDAVVIDHASGTRTAIQHLIESGHRRIGFISGQSNLHPAISRLAGYRKALRLGLIRYSADLVRLSSFGADAAYQHTLSLLSQPNRPTAIFAGGTSFLPGILRAARQLNLKIPRDLSIIAGADSDIATLMTPSISRVRWNHAEVGQAAGRLLLERLEHPDRKPQRLEFETEFILEGSCAPPRQAKK